MLGCDRVAVGGLDRVLRSLNFNYPEPGKPSSILNLIVNVMSELLSDVLGYTRWVE
jgi:hypothetical protein